MTGPACRCGHRPRLHEPAWEGPCNACDCVMFADTNETCARHSYSGIRGCGCGEVHRLRLLLKRYMLSGPNIPEGAE
jgi:hypothetical protein